MTPGGLAQSLLALPYYRDDSCFDDGTGSDPGPRVDPGLLERAAHVRRPGDRADEAAEVLDAGGRDPRSRATREYYQGDIGTHGLHLLFQLESDNARQEVPIDEIVSEQRMVLLPGQQGNVGEQYGREFEKPLVVRVQDGGVSRRLRSAASEVRLVTWVHAPQQPHHRRRGHLKPGQQVGPLTALIPISRCGPVEIPTIPQPTSAIGCPACTTVPTRHQAGAAWP